MWEIEKYRLVWAQREARQEDYAVKVSGILSSAPDFEWFSFTMRTFFKKSFCLLNGERGLTGREREKL